MTTQGRTLRNKTAGINKKSCKVCGAKFNPFKTTQVVCSVACAAEYARAKEAKKQERQRKQIQKQNRKDLAELNRRDRKWQIKQTQASFNKLRKLQEFMWFKERNLEPECISCGKTKMDWCCGHFKTVGASPGLRFDPMNTYLQCNKYCNMSLSGNIEGTATTRGYKQGLIERFGEEKAAEIFDYCERMHRADWTCEELEQMRKGMNAQIRDLEKQLQDVAA